MTQRKTQTATYWQNQFTIGNREIEFIQNQILDANRPLSLDEIALALVRQQCEAEERAIRSELEQGQLYRPQDSFTIGDSIMFPALEFALGTVEYTREGYHPDYGKFTVLGVKFPGRDAPREFVADFKQPDALIVGKEQSLASMQGLLSPEELYEQYSESIRARVKATLDANDDFVEFHDQYFLRDLLPDFHEGLFNIADAAIDINQGPLAVDDLIRQMDLTDNGEITDVLRFSVNYRLSNDERFDDVGPSGHILWYLQRLEPPEAHLPPRRLQVDHNLTYSSDSFDEETRPIVAEIDDETTNPEDIPPTPPEQESVTVVLTYPHWRVGSLPLTPKTQPFFPISYYNPVLFELIDGRTGDSFAGWSVLKGKYVFGLEEWYKKHKLPVGAYIIIKRTDDPLRVIVDYKATRTHRDWIRVVGMSGNRLTFQMNTQHLNCEYDELMIIGDPNPQAADQLWQAAAESNLSLYHILCDVFPELTKLNPQSTVHLKTLYSAVNVIRRFSPGLIIEELNRHACFIPMAHGYWTFDPNLKDE